MKLPAILASNTTAKLERARAERDKAQAVVADLRAKLVNLDVGLDDFTPAALTLSGQIHVNEKAAEVLEQQLAGLESKLADEERASAAARREAGIGEVEKMLPERLEIIAEGVTLARELVNFSEKLSAWQKRFLKRYPADLKRPLAHHINNDWIMKNLLAAVRMQPAESNELLAELASAAAQMHDELIADLCQTDAKAQQEEAA